LLNDPLLQDSRCCAFLHLALSYMLQLHLMKASARGATLFILLFFIIFNGVQVYLILERIADAKAKFTSASSRALFSTLLHYDKLTAIDTASRPKNGFVVYSLKEISVNRRDSQTIEFRSSTPVHFGKARPAFIEAVMYRGVTSRPHINRPKPKPLDLVLLGKLYRKALDSNKVNTQYRLDTFAGAVRRDQPMKGNDLLAKKRTKEYPLSTAPIPIFFYPNFSIFAELKYDRSFFFNDLIWPMLGFAFILIISNTALYFVYKTIRKQKRINELKTDFINNITHEMKTPITIGTAGLEALEHHITPTERTSFYLQTSKRQLNLLNDFVERILDSAVQDIAVLTLKKEQIDLHQLFEELVQSHSVLQKKPTRFRLTGEKTALIQGDRLHLQTAFHNIIDNAIKYSNGAVDIDIDIVDNNRDCTIKIRDNGMGIPPQYLKNIFEKFFRVPQGDAQPIKGFGLGLYYVSSIIKKHSGNITVHSKKQSGTEFIITLPKNA
jgi:two-component system, OmpR family, phosphate regulon sensor histidine kinase PhoR